VTRSTDPPTGYFVQVVGDDPVLIALRPQLDGTGVELTQDRDLWLLRDREWASAKDPLEVESSGRLILRVLNGVLAASNVEGPRLGWGGVVEIKASGGRTFFDSATVTVRITGGLRHAAPDSPPTLDPAKILGAARVDPLIPEILGDFAMASDWFDLYKVYERVRSAAGGQTVVDAFFGKRARDRFTLTANHYRHAEEPLPPKPLSFDEAHLFIARIISAWVNAGS
jgi:hypothetical protein